MTNVADAPPDVVGVIGLGNMGLPIATCLAEAGHRLVVYDSAGTRERTPAGASSAGSVSEVAAAASVVLLSLPDGKAVAEVAAAIAATSDRRTTTVIDTSTIGIAVAQAAAAQLAEIDIAYVDAPVSGGIAGAKAGKLTAMVATDAARFAAIAPLIRAFVTNPFLVGTEVGQGQAMKLLNNFLSATAMVATSEALAFGSDHGLDMRTMLEVLNVSSGQNTATSDKFPRCVVTRTYDGGFPTDGLVKDIGLYLDCVAESGARATVGAAVRAAWKAAAEALPGADYTRIYDHVRAARRQSA